MRGAVGCLLDHLCPTNYDDVQMEVLFALALSPHFPIAFPSLFFFGGGETRDAKGTWASF
jgi:hypothetical protein